MVNKKLVIRKSTNAIVDTPSEKMLKKELRTFNTSVTKC